MMQFESLSVLTGTEACNAQCPFCVAKISPDFEGVDNPNVHWRNFHKAARLAHNARVNNIIITSYGDPTLFPNTVSSYLEALAPYQFPLIEMQTNAILFETKVEKYQKYAQQWYDSGLDIMAISIVHYEDEINRSCYLPYKNQYINLRYIIAQLRHIGFSVRLNCTLCAGWIDSVDKLQRLIAYAQALGAFQLTIRPVSMPTTTRNQAVHQWISGRLLPESQWLAMKNFLDTNGTLILQKEYGANIYDVQGYNVCLTNCFTRNSHPKNMRQLIFFPNGAIRFDWEYNGILLAAKEVISDTGG